MVCYLLRRNDFARREFSDQREIQRMCATITCLDRRESQLNSVRSTAFRRNRSCNEVAKSHSLARIVQPYPEGI